MLDEHLELLNRLRSGDLVRHEGRHYRVAGPDWSGICYPPPLQQPRIPIWVGGSWPGRKAFVRAARWDGVVPMRSDGAWHVEDTAGVAGLIRSLRTSTGTFDIVVSGETDPSDASRADRHREHGVAGATWWVESVPRGAMAGATGGTGRCPRCVNASPAVRNAGRPRRSAKRRVT